MHHHHPPHRPPDPSATPRPHLPEWAPPNAPPAFAGRVLPGVPGGHHGLPDPATTPAPADRPRHRPRPAIDPDAFARGVLAGDRTILARAITLIESNAPQHAPLATELIRRIIPHAGNARRIGITGVPGAGKSTLVECFGTMLCDQGHKVAVLAVDPSSSLTGGSVLGDKTRMERLARHPAAFIRPSPSAGNLGGVTRKSRETLALCEAAGFDVIIVETVGVGQSEGTVRSMVDFFLLVAIAGAGDELQGFKKGVMELADCIAVNKADGDNRTRALATRAETQRVLHYLSPATPGWTTPALALSALTGEGVPELWATIGAFYAQLQPTGAIDARRQSQNVAWLRDLIQSELHRRFLADPQIAQLLDRLEPDVAANRITAPAAAAQLITHLKW